MATCCKESRNNGVKRGVFIVFEGIDGSGKSSQCSNLCSYLLTNDISYEMLVYPNRASLTGKLINNYLTNDIIMDDRAIHLLFAGNRHEDSTKIINLLSKGVNVICDRYSYSGAAYSVSKVTLNSNNNNDNHKQSSNNDKLVPSSQSNLSLEWCFACEQGLPKPDAIIYLNVDLNALQRRAVLGQERYETLTFLQRVKQSYEVMQNFIDCNLWHVCVLDVCFLFLFCFCFFTVFYVQFGCVIY